MFSTLCTTRKWFFGVLALFCVATANAQNTPEAAVRTFVDSFNAGDSAKAASVYTASGTNIVDEFAPYSWNGPKALDDWGAAFDANSKALGITEPKVTLGAPMVRNTTATDAYLIFPSLYAYRQKGAAMRETARVAIVLRKEGAAWKITGWTWTGTVPKPIH